MVGTQRAECREEHCVPIFLHTVAHDNQILAESNASVMSVISAS